MKKYLKIRGKEQKDTYVEGDKIYTSILKTPIENVKEMEDGSYIGNVGNRYVYLKKTLWGDYYTSLTSKVIVPICLCSEKLDTVFCLVSRNANTSIVLSAMKLEGFDSDNYSNDSFLWHDDNAMKFCQEKGLVKDLSKVDFSKYSNFVIVLDDPLKRFIRTTYKILRDKKVIPHLNNCKSFDNIDRFLDELIFYTDICENDMNFLWERHVGMQYRYVNACLHYNPTLTIVKLDELPSWWEETYNVKWFKNNVSKNKPITKESFSKEQWNKVEKVLEKDIGLWNDVLKLLEKK